MLRREFMGLAAVAVAGGGCAHLPTGTSEPRFSAARMDTVLAGIDATVRAIREWFRRSLRADSQPDDVVLVNGLEDLWSAMAVYTAFTELPLHAQMHPGMQRRIRAAGNWHHDGTEQLHAALTAPEGGLLPRLEHGLQNLPDDASVLAFAESQSAAFGVAGGGRRKMQRLVRDALRSFRGKSAADLVEAVRVHREVATEEMIAEDDSSEVAKSAFAAHGDWVSAGVVAVDPDEPSVEGSDKFHSKKSQSVESLRKLGLTFVVMGGALLVVGIVVIAMIPGCFCIGALIALPGIGLLIAGGVLLGKADRRAETEALTELVPAAPE